ncbi:MAG: hypothetical protein F6K47_28210 [Symploca sp. SIO2E6]|nr:hypothetical protein [Symploca sp. SIO2E6]
MNIPETVTFEEALTLTQSLMSQMSTGELSPSEIEQAIAQLVNTQNGARGFFVTYLTSEGTLADNPSPEVIGALQSSPEVVPELLVKNLAMSTATALNHRRNGKEDIAQKSDQVRARTIHLIEQIKMTQVSEIAAELHESAKTYEGNYKAFLKRWQYDAEQRQIIAEAMAEVLGGRELKIKN